METDIAERRYRIQSEPGYYYAGYLSNGQQLLMSIGAIRSVHDFVAVEFDPQGNYVRTLTKAISQATLSCSTDDPAWWNNYWDELDLWAEELGLEHGTIAVKKFSFPDQDLRIQHLPPIWQEMLDKGEEFDEQDREAIAFWQEANLFVLIWGQDFEINEDGELVST